MSKSTPERSGPKRPRVRIPASGLADWNWTVGTVVAPFGRVGELKVNLETDFPERFAALREVCLRPAAPPQQPRLFEVLASRLHKSQVLLKLKGIESINDAELWRGASVQIPRADAVPLPEDSFYVADIIGFDVLTADGKVLGKLEKILPYPAQDLMQIGEILIPMVKEFVREVDTAERRIVVAPPEGVLPDEEPENAD